MIVLSEETRKGGVKINEKRKENGLQELDMHVIDLAHDDQHSSEEEAKLSSSNQRMRLLGTILRPPKVTTLLPGSEELAKFNYFGCYFKFTR